MADSNRAKAVEEIRAEAHRYTEQMRQCKDQTSHAYQYYNGLRQGLGRAIEILDKWNA